MAQFGRLGKSEVTCHIDDMADISPVPKEPVENRPSPGRSDPAQPPESVPPPREIGGPKGPEPTRYGDWEVNGRCSDF
jgi:hypothetical protein